MRVLWTERAQWRLQKIEDYIARDKPHRAITFVDELIDAGNNLAEFPHSGHPPKEAPDGPYREVIHEGYRIIFRPVGDTIFITSVFHGSKVLEEADKEL